MKTIYNILILTLIACSLSGCNGSQEPVPNAVYGVEHASKLVLSPNSPVLVADGTSALSFSGDFYYTTPATKDSLFLLLPDRVDQSKVVIKSSDGKTFTAADSYTCNDDSPREVTFTANYGSLTSDPVTVQLYPASKPVESRREIPVTVYLFSSDKTAHLASDLTDDYLGQVIDELNRICDGSAYPTAPSKGDLGVTYKLTKVSRKKIKPEEEKRDYLSDFCRKKKLYDSAKDMLYIMIITPSTTSPDMEIVPKYTFGDPKSLPGVRREGLTPIHSIDEVKDQLVSTDICIDLSFTLLQTYSSHVAASAIAYRLGLFYGLISSEVDTRFADLKGKTDVDYCPDTYTVDRTFSGTRMVTIPLQNGARYRYRPLHVMESEGPSYVFTADQAKRIKVAMRDIPFRGQGVPK